MKKYKDNRIEKINTIYYLSSINDWIDIAFQLKENLKWQPSYCIVHSAEQYRAFKAKFPETICHFRSDAMNGISPPEITADTAVIDAEHINKQLYHEHIAMRMMDRTSNGKLNYNERRRLFNRIVINFLNMINTIKPSMALFSAVPHDIASYLLYAVCDVKNINTYIVRNSFMHFIEVDEKVEKPNAIIENEYKKILHSNTIHEFNINSIEDKELKELIKKIKSSYDEAEPYYMKEQKKKDKKHNVVISTTCALKDMIPILNDRIKQLSFSRKVNLVLSLPKKVVNNYLYSYQTKLYKKRLQKKYLSMCQNINFKRPYIYLALHYQPERSTSPEGGFYVDQWLMANLLSKYIPKDWYIYIKEHKSQFYNAPKLQGHLGRSESFYEDLVKLKNVKLVPLEIPSFDLIDNSQAVATVTGTVGLEAILRGKPVMAFGYAWYRNCEGVFYVPNREDVKNAIETIRNGYRINDKAVIAFLSIVEKKCAKAYWSQQSKKSANISYSENVKRIVKIIEDYVDFRQT